MYNYLRKLLHYRVYNTDNVDYTYVVNMSFIEVLMKGNLKFLSFKHSSVHSFLQTCIPFNIVQPVLQYLQQYVLIINSYQSTPINQLLMHQYYTRIKYRLLDISTAFPRELPIQRNNFISLYSEIYVHKCSHGNFNRPKYTHAVNERS